MPTPSPFDPQPEEDSVESDPMALDNDSSNESTTAPRSQRSFPWFWLGTFIGSVFSAVGLGLAAWGWVFIQDDLSPLIEDVLTDYLDRPVDLGDVEQVTFGSIQVGSSTVGASEQDPTMVEADTVIVNFDLIDTLLTSELGLDLTVIGAEGNLNQDIEKGWLNFYFPEQEESEERRFKINLNDVQLEDSELTLVPLPVEGQAPDPIQLDNVRGSLSLDKVAVADEISRRVRFEVQGSPLDGGEITYKGEVQPVEAVPDSEADAPKANDTAPSRKIDFATKFFIQSDAAPLADIMNFTLSTLELQTDAVTFDSGEVSGTMDMEFLPQQPIDYSGALSVVNADISTDILPLPLLGVEGETQFQGNEWTVDRLVGDYGEISAIAQGLIDFDRGYNLTATTQNVTVEEFANTVDLELPVPTTGNFDAIARMGGPIDSPEFSGTATADSPVVVDKVTFTSAITDFFLKGNQLSLSDIAATPSTGGSLRGNGQVSLTTGAPFTFNLTGRSLPATQLANLYDLDPGVRLGLVSADATVVGDSGTVVTTVDWDAPQAQYPGSGSITISNGTDLAFSDTVFAIGGGTASGSGSLIDGQFDSDVTFQSVQLNAFSPDLRGDVNGQFRFSGSTANATLAGIRATGDITFSDGVAAFADQFASLDSPLTAQVAWNGEKIQVIQATADRISANGTLTPTFDQGFTGLERLDLNITAQDYALAELPFDVPDAIVLTGLADVTGTLAGAPSAPSFNGNLRLNNLVANSLPFDTPLAGTVAYSPTSGVALNVGGNTASSTDKIALNIAPTAADSGAIPPLDFDINWQGAIARGRTQGDILTAEANNFPLAALNFPAQGVADIGQLRGTLTATDVTANLTSQTLEGDIAINQLGVGYISAGRLAGKVRYADRIATLTSGELILNNQRYSSQAADLASNLDNRRYSVTGQLDLNSPEPIYSANIDTESGDVQNILTALSIYRLEDFRRGLTPPDWLDDPLSQSDLDRLFDTVPTGEVTLAAQLDRLAEIQALETESAIAEAADPIPPLRDLNGPFQGSFSLTGSGTDFNLDFDLIGQNWTWGQDYSAQDVVARGTLTPNVLTLEPVRFASAIAVPITQLTSSDTPLPSTPNSPSPNSPSPNPPSPNSPIPFPTITAVRPVDAFINLAGQLVFGRETELNSDLQATVANIDANAFQEILQLPIDVNGLANARATLSGTLANPQIRGGGDLTAATINGTPIETADAQILYRNAQLLLVSNLTADTPEQPLTLTAEIPYAFDFMDVRPESDAITVNVNVKNEGLALLNIFTDQVAWESGEGEINLLVDGTLSNPNIFGSAFLSNAVLNAKVLPEPLINVNGNATFAGDQIIIDTLQGQFSDGQLTAAGTFPLVTPIITGTQLTALSSSSAEVPINVTNAGEVEDETTGEATQVGGANSATSAIELLDANRPLTANLQNIDLTLENELYSGGVNGQIIVGGSALGDGPQIGGKVVLSQGRIVLPDGADTEAVLDPENAQLITNDETSNGTATSQNELSNKQNDSTEGGITPNFRDLDLTLGDSIEIVQGNLLNFVADGSLILNGPPDDLEPNGIIRLRSGRVNLFATTFRLSGRENTAIFTAETGLQNPFLDVSLRASVPEVDSSGLLTSTPFVTGDVADTSNTGFQNPGSLRTIRVRANVDGPADAIFENLELTSSPPRSQSELIGLIGGSFVTALESTVGSLGGGGDGFEGLINLVSGALLSNVQDVIGTSLSLSEFRLFPVTAASRGLSEDEDDTGLDFAAEAGFDLTDDTSVTVQKILTDDTNPEFGLNYRLTDSLTVRANTNLDDINQVLLEYEIRF